MSDHIIVASGYFNPLHAGHIEYFTKAKALDNKLIVIVNNDKQAMLKRGSVFMSCKERIKIVRSLKMVDFAIESVDEDRTVCRTLSILHPHVFCNGGDQNNTTIPEREICEKMGIKLTDGLGEKIQSSSWLLAKMERK